MSEVRYAVEFKSFIDGAWIASQRVFLTLLDAKAYQDMDEGESRIVKETITREVVDE